LKNLLIKKEALMKDSQKKNFIVFNFLNIILLKGVQMLITQDYSTEIKEKLKIL